MSGNPLDGYNKTLNQVERDKQAKQKGTGWGTPKLYVADVHGIEVMDSRAEENRVNPLVAAAMAIKATMEVQSGEESLDPRTA